MDNLEAQASNAYTTVTAPAAGLYSRPGGRLRGEF